MLDFCINPEPDTYRPWYMIGNAHRCRADSKNSVICVHVLQFGFGRYCRHPGCPNFKAISEDDMDEDDE